MNLYRDNPQNLTHQMMVRRNNQMLVKNVSQMRPMMKVGRGSVKKSAQSTTNSKKVPSSQEMFKSAEQSRENEILLKKMLLIMKRPAEEFHRSNFANSNTSMITSVSAQRSTLSKGSKIGRFAARRRSNSSSKALNQKQFYNVQTQQQEGVNNAFFGIQE